MDPAVGWTLFVGQAVHATVVTVGVGAYLFTPHVQKAAEVPVLVLPVGQAVHVVPPEQY